ncbi:MAG: penicillin acylase family protein [Gammaproteobacteria bacterium]|nr:penicillin acylase family protein [Gammaproteobacteria bacterium]
MKRIFAGLLAGILLFVIAVCVIAYFMVHASLPPLDGERAAAGIEREIVIERDALGVPTLSGASRADLAFATGFVHGQDRYFQMDLMRRRAAGELAELFGAAAVPVDRESRLHRFRMRAREVVGVARPGLRHLIEAYARGVNAGLASLGARPFEYLLLRDAPREWLPEDSVLVAYAMWFTLTDHTGGRDALRGLLAEVLPLELVAFLDPVGTRWDAPIDGSVIEVPPIPGPEVYDLRTLDRALFDTPSSGPRRRQEGARGRLVAALTRRVDAGIGSNNWVVAGDRAAGGHALLANDTHLPLEVPNTWYRIRLLLQAPGAPAPSLDLSGMTLPGAPMLVAGSNRRIAWGFTNSYGDWVDLVSLEPDPDDETRYLTPQGSRSFEQFTETIRVKGGEDVAVDMRSTVWGPVIGADARGRLVALRWLAHEPAATNVEIMGLEQVEDARAALDIANRSGIPPQNVVVADRDGGIGWTIMGRIPARAAYDSRFPRSSTDGGAKWLGWLDPSEYPRSLNPAQGLLWTANGRVVGGEALGKIGTAGYAFGARAQQIRNDLRRRDALSVEDMLDIQLDDRARYLDRWREVLLDLLGDAAGNPRRAELRALLDDWAGRADPDSAAYRLVREWHDRVRDAAFLSLTAEVRARFPDTILTPPHQFEGAMWRLVEQRPVHLLDPRFETWGTFLLAQADAMLANFQPMPGTLRERTWGEANTVRIQHPVSRALPALSRWLDMPTVQLPGDNDMPRVQRINFGASERFAVSPGREEEGYFHMPAGQSGHPLSPYYRAGHDAWMRGDPLPFLPGAAEHRLVLRNR